MLTGLLLATAFMVYKGSQVRISYNFSRLLPHHDSTQIFYENFQKTFKQVGNTVVIAAEDIDIFSSENYAYWEQFEDSLRAIEGVNGVLSPISAFTLQRNDSLKQLEVKSIRDGLDPDQIPEKLRERFEKLPFYEGLLYSADKESPLMLLYVGDEFLYNENIIRIVESIKTQIAHFEARSGFKIHVSGLPYIRMANTRKVSSEILLFIVMAIAVTSFLLFFFLRSFKAMLISMVVVIIGVCFTFGLMGFFQFQISILTALIPTLIIVIGVPNCIFLINKFHSEYKDHGNKILAIQRVIRKVGNATLLTNFTTALGFAAFILTDSSVLIEFGIVASINILMVFVISIIIIPIVYSFSKPPKSRHYKHLEKKWINGWMGFLEKLVTQHRKSVYAATIALVLLAIYGATQIYTTGNISEEYSEKDPLLKDLKYLEKEFGGVVPLEIVIDTKQKNGVQKSATLKRIERLEKALLKLPNISKPLSIVDGIKFAKQGFYRGEPDFFALPTSQERNFILSYLPKGSNSKLDLLTTMVDSTGQIARISLQAADLDTEESKILHQEIERLAHEIFPQERYEVSLTGASIIFLKGTSYLIKNLIISLLLAIVVIAIIMTLLFRSFAMVVVSLIPNLFPLVLTAGIMGWFGIPLKPSTILVFSIAFGISVDDTIHYLAKYRQELRSSNWNIGKSVIRSLRETGVSMFYTSIILFFGFSVFIASEFGGTVSLGVLVSITLVVAMLSNLIILPSLLLSLEKLVLDPNFNHPLITLYKRDEEVIDPEDEDEMNPEHTT
jgi:predicted RND superfamily exporter protein